MAWAVELQVSLVPVLCKINEGIVKSFICLSLLVNTSVFGWLVEDILNLEDIFNLDSLKSLLICLMKLSN